MKSNAFWMLDACVLFSLSLLYLYQGYHRKNQWFTVWLCSGVVMQLIAAWGLAAGWPRWMEHVRVVGDVATYGLTMAVLVVAAMRRECPVNRSVLWGVGGMVALNLFARCLGTSVAPPVRVWLRNVAFFGPAIFLLISLSNLRVDRLPLWVNSMLRALSLRVVDRAAVASISLPDGILRGRPRLFEPAPGSAGPAHNFSPEIPGVASYHPGAGVEPSAGQEWLVETG